MLNKQSQTAWDGRTELRQRSKVDGEWPSAVDLLTDLPNTYHGYCAIYSALPSFSQAQRLYFAMEICRRSGTYLIAT